MKKKVITKNNKYKVVFKEFNSKYLKLILYRRYYGVYIKVDYTLVDKGFSIDSVDFKSKVIETIELYEWQQGYRDEIPYRIKEFNDWNGVINE